MGIERTLDELLATLHETYEHTLREIKQTNRNIGGWLLQCVSLASRLLQVEELAEILAFDFDAVTDSEPSRGGPPEKSCNPLALPRIPLSTSEVLNSYNLRTVR